MNLGAKRLKNVEPNRIREISNRAKELERKGKDIIHLEIGEPDFKTSNFVNQAAQKAMDNGETHYSPIRGLLTLREAVSKKVYEDNDIVADPESEILITSGAAEAIYLAILAHCNEQDEVIIVEPTFLSYRQLVSIAGATPIRVPTYETNDWIVNPCDISKAITPKTKMIILNLPNNPTGAIYPRYVLEEIANIAISNDLIIISDEIYEKIIYSNEELVSIGSLPKMKERTLTINGFSKAYAMTGWRLGYVITSPELLLPMVKLHQYTVTCVSTFSQYGAISALLEKEKKNVEARMTKYKKRREIVINKLNELKGVTYCIPKGAFFVFINIKAFNKNSEKFVEEVLNKAGIALTPGSVFSPYGEGYVRLSFAITEEKLLEAFKRFKKFLDNFDH